MPEKLNARTKFIQYVEQCGWVLDPGKVLRSSRGFGSDKQEVLRQNPHAFTKAADHGGSWHIELDYSSNYHSTGNVLKKITVTHRAGPGESAVSPFGIERGWGSPNNVLKTPTNSTVYTFLWDALEHVQPDNSVKDATLRERAEKLVRKPDLAVWLAAGLKHDYEVAKAEADARAEADRIARRQPMPLTVTYGDWNSEWKNLTRTLESAAKSLTIADGKSDLPALTAQAQQALNAITAVLTEDARQAHLGHVNRLAAEAWQTRVVGGVVDLEAL